MIITHCGVYADTRCTTAHLVSSTSESLWRLLSSHTPLFLYSHTWTYSHTCGKCLEHSDLYTRYMYTFPGMHAGLLHRVQCECAWTAMPSHSICGEKAWLHEAKLTWSAAQIADVYTFGLIIASPMTESHQFSPLRQHKQYTCTNLALYQQTVQEYKITQRKFQSTV